MEANVTLFDRLFSTTIAFLLPGLAVLVGAATVNPVVAGWFGSASTSPSFVGLLFVLLAALAIGMVVTTVRWWIFECAHVGGRRLILPSPPFDESKRRAELFAAYEDLRFQHYYHYLAYANMAVAIPIALLVWLVGDAHTTGDVVTSVGLAVPVMLVLGAAGREALQRYVQRRLRLMGSFIQEPTTA